MFTIPVYGIIRLTRAAYPSLVEESSYSLNWNKTIIRADHLIKSLIEVTIHIGTSNDFICEMHKILFIVCIRVSTPLKNTTLYFPQVPS